MKAYFLQLHNAASIDNLCLYRRLCDTLGNVDIFASDVGKYASAYGWQMHGQETHLRAIVAYICFLSFFTASTFGFQQWVTSNDIGYQFIAYTSEIIVLLFLIFCMINEGRQIYIVYGPIYTKFMADKVHRSKAISFQEFSNQSESNLLRERILTIYRQIPPVFDSSSEQDLIWVPILIPLAVMKFVLSLLMWTIADLISIVGLVWSVAVYCLYHKTYQRIRPYITSKLSFFYDIWNLIDDSIIFFGLVGTSSRLNRGYETDTSRCFLAIASVAIWIQILYYLRPFESSGHLGKRDKTIS